MKNTVRWQVTSTALNSFVGTLETAYGYAKDLNESLTNIRIVTENSAEDMALFAEQANKAAKALSTTTVDYTDAALIYYQQGLTEQEVLDRTETTIKMANAAGVSAQTASDQLTAVWNNFYDGSKSLEYYADVMVRLGADTASSSDEISEGIQQFAAVAETVGLSYEYAASALATVTATTRESANTVGTAFRTLFARIQGLNLGETLDDGTTLNKYSQALDKVGINIFDVNGEIKTMDTLLDEMGEKWETLSNDQQIALAQTVAGVRQYTRLIALMDKWDFFQENLESAYGASGSLQEQADIYAESWEAARDRVRASAEDIYDSIINPELFISADNIASPFLSGIADIVDGMGGLNGILLTTGTLITSVYGDKIANSMRNMATNISIITGVEAERARVLQSNAVDILKNLESTYAAGDAEAYRLNIMYRQAEVQGAINSKYDSMTIEQRKQLQSQQQQLDILRDENLIIADTIGKLQQSATEKFGSIFINIPQGSEGWQDQLKAEIDQWNKKAKKTYRINLEINPDTTVETVFSNISKQLDSLAKKHASLRLISNQFQNLDATSEKYEQNLKELIATYSNLGTSNKTVQEMESYLKRLGTQADNTESQIKELGNVLSQLGVNKNNINSYIDTLMNLHLQLQRGEITQEAYNNAVQRVVTNINNLNSSSKDWASGIVQAGNAISSLLMAVNGINSIGRVFSDEDMTSGERFITILTGLSMIIPSVTSAMKFLNQEKAISVAVTGTEVTVTGSSIAANLARTAANKILAVSEGEVATATQVSNAAMAARLIMLAPYVALIAALVGGIYLAVKAYNADADAAKRAAEAAEETQQAVEDATSAYEELKQTISDYSEALDSINELEKGTEEFAEQIEDANKKAKELIETYKLFGQYSYGSNGQIVFDEGVLENLQEQQASNLSSLESANYQTQITASNANLKALATSTIRETGLTYGYSYQDRSGNEQEMQRLISHDMLDELANNYYELMSEASDGFVTLESGIQLSVDAVADAKDALEEYADAAKSAAEETEYFASQILTNYVGQNYEGTIDSNEDLIRQAASNQVGNTQLSSGKTVDEALAEINAANANNATIKDLLRELYNTDYMFLTDERLGKEYAEKVLGWDTASIGYSGGWGKGTLSNAATGESVEMTDQAMRIALQNLLMQEKILKQYADEIENNAEGAIDIDSYIQELNEDINNINTQFGEEFGTAYAQALANEGDIDFVNLLEQSFSPEQVEELKTKVSSGLLDIPQEFLDALTSSIEDYDASNYWANQLETSKKNAAEIGSILSSYQNEEELDEDQLAFLDELMAKYEDLSNLQATNQHDYLERLREIQEQEEKTYLTGLEDSANQQREDIQQLESEIARLEDAGYAPLDLIEELQQKLQKLADTEYKIQIALDTDLASDIDQAFGLANEIEQLKGYLEDGLEITYDRAQEIIAAGYGAMLTNARETADSTIELNREVVNNFIDGKQQEIEADRLARIKQLETEREALVAKRDSLYAGLEALKSGLKAEDAASKAAALAQAAIYKADADSKEITAEKKADAEDLANEEIANDAAALVDALGIMHETDAENSQQAYDDIETAANQSGASQVSVWNQVQLAAVKASQAIKAAYSGQESTYDPVLFEGQDNVSVGATSSQTADNTYVFSKADVQTLTDEILNAAQNNIEVLNSATEQAIDEIQLELNSVNAQIGSVDAGIAALKSANLSLDKTQANLGSGSGGDNEGTKYDAEDEKTLEDIEDRYHEITREIENQNDLLDDIGNNIDRAYGAKKLQAYQKELQELEKQQANYNKMLDEAETYLEKDRSELQGLFNNSLIFDENGEIEGYQDVLQSIIDDYNNNFLTDYNAFLLMFSSLTKDEQEARQAEYDSWQLQKEVADELFQARQDALAQYEETLDKVQDVKDEQEELERNIADNRLNQIEYKLEVAIDIKDAKDAVNELTRQIAESFGDELTHGMEVARIDKNSMNENIEIIKSYEEALKSYQEELANATDATNIDEIVSKLSDLQGKMISTAEALLDWVEGLEEMLPDALDAASERFAAFTDQLDHNESVLGLIKELYALQGVTYKTEEGFEQLQEVSEETMKAQVANAQLNKQWYDGIRQELLEAQAALDALGGDETDPAYDGLKANRDALLEEFNEAQEAMLSSAQAAMETAQEMYTQAIERAVYEFGQAVSGGVGLDLLQDKFDHYIEQEDRYLDKVNEAYEVSSWYNKLQQDIDKATNSKMKDQLKQLQEEIDIRRENNTLSEYDLEILEAKYNVLQAQMALEDAQNAKNQLRLVRDSQGNWNYQYTADASQIADAEQNLLDAENEWYNIAKQQVEDVTGEIISTWQECQDKIKEIYSDMTLTDEERSARAQEIYSYYTQKVKDLESEKQIAIQDMTEAGNKALIDMAIVAGDEVSDLTGITSQEIQDIIANSGSSIIDLLLSDNEQIQDIVGSNTKLIGLFDNVFAKDLANMTANAGNFEEFLSNAMDEASGAMEDYQTTVSGVADQTGTSLDDLKDYIDDVSTSTDLCSEAGSKAVTQMLEQISTIQDLSQEYLDMADSVREYVRSLEEAARAAGNTIESAGSIDKDDLPSSDSSQSSDTDKGSSGDSGSGSSSSGTGGGNGIPEVGDEVIYTGGTYYHDSYGTDPAGRRGPGKKVRITNIAKGRPYPIHVQSNNSAYGWLKESQISGFDTGGYTGEFDNAKLAFLHEKELVLNQEDTKNILAAVSAMRAFGPSFIASIEKTLDGNALSISSIMASRLGTNTQIAPTDNVVQPNINIERVEFPNATSSDEIQDAIRSLADDATQWANRRKE